MKFENNSVMDDAEERQKTIRGLWHVRLVVGAQDFMEGGVSSNEDFLCAPASVEKYANGRGHNIYIIVTALQGNINRKKSRERPRKRFFEQAAVEKMGL